MGNKTIHESVSFLFGLSCRCHSMSLVPYPQEYKWCVTERSFWHPINLKLCYCLHHLCNISDYFALVSEIKITWWLAIAPLTHTSTNENSSASQPPADNIQDYWSCVAISLTAISAHILFCSFSRPLVWSVNGFALDLHLVLLSDLKYMVHSRNNFI